MSRPHPEYSQRARIVMDLLRRIAVDQQAASFASPWALVGFCCSPSNQEKHKHQLCRPIPRRSIAACCAARAACCAALAVRETIVAGRRCIICRNDEEARKDAEARAELIAGLARKLAQGDKAWSHAAVTPRNAYPFLRERLVRKRVGKLREYAATDHARTAGRSAPCGHRPGPRTCALPPHPK